ncbi:MAG: hypothetical protein JWQ21_1025 [Herminiimonas sp.]|nr:hypothetical protein [Herminiimonas sp.]
MQNMFDVFDGGLSSGNKVLRLKRNGADAMQAWNPIPLESIMLRTEQASVLTLYG